jgi:hypothetical protein
MQTYKITTDAGQYNVTTDGGNTPTNTSGLDTLSDLIGRAGRGAYNAPIVHPLFKMLGQASQAMGGASPEDIYNNLGPSTTVPQQVAEGLGSAAPALAVGGPMIKAAEALPLVGESAIATGAVGMSAYGATGGGIAAMENGQPILPSMAQGAVEGAKQGAVWGALGRLGSTVGAKVLPKALFSEETSMMLPKSLQGAYTPEGMGAIAGGLLAGGITAPDEQRIAGALIGGALSAYNPAQKWDMMESTGRTLGFDKVKKWLGVFGEQQQAAAEPWKEYGSDKVMQAGSFVAPNGEDILHVAAKKVLDEFGAIKDELHSDAQQIMPALDQKPRTQEEMQRGSDLLTWAKNYVNSMVRTPAEMSGLKRVLNNTADMQLITIPTAIAKEYNLVDEKFSQKNYKAPVSDLNMITDPKIKQDLMSRAIKAQFENKIGAERTVKNVSYSKLEDLKQIVGEYAGNGGFEGKVATVVRDNINNFLKEVSPKEYTPLMKKYTKYFEAKQKLGNVTDYRELAQNFAKPLYGAERTTRINRLNNMKEIDNYITEARHSGGTVSDLVKQYHAYQAFAKPQVAGMSKTLPMRIIASMVAGFAHMGPIGTIAGWHMGSPEAWIPIMKGALKGGTKPKAFKR